ncbi:DUF2784 domain-containing protein [Hoyosella rhizosphaerae]|uniref:DUF2784 domain-containing protein n=1 Tax=Hoyosella rhizosphaerae TaxID=1755582 RepID=A0A916U3R6_9ACTN|nr:DUF2784 domain-containing protein [Hoyosella rhizosphaerae]MBN4926541.1 DUF2784 domain-containing protein [Hoyosella rhizosphaerae]GGC58437.1 hypothetical protein GCM10011410_08680 [Hoyosella rhizosphaerae]
MVYRIIGETAMLTHFLFIAYVMLGGFLAWKWPRTMIVHAICVAWAVGLTVVNLFGVGWHCPLTYVEDWARRQAGEAGLPESGFIDHYLTGVVYPQEYLNLARGVLLACVIISWIGFVYLRRRANLSKVG